MQPLKPNTQRAKLAIALIWTVLLFEILTIFSGYLQYNLLQELDQGVDISMEEIDNNDLRETLLGVGYGIVFLISAICFISWFRRSYYNLHQRVNYLQFPEGWAAGSWFVPILNLFRPFQIMKELYVDTPLYLKKNDITPPIKLNTATLGIWWMLWIISNILGQVIFRASNSADSLDELLNLTIASMVLGIIGIPLALLAIKIVSDYSRVEQLLWEVNEDTPTENSETVSTDLSSLPEA